MSSQPKSSSRSRLAGHVVPHHPLADRSHDDIEHAVDAGPVAHRRRHGRHDCPAIAAEQGVEQRAVVAPRRIDGQRGERRKGRVPARPRMNGRMYGNTSSRVPYTMVGTRYGSTVSARSQPIMSRSSNAFCE